MTLLFILLCVAVYVAIMFAGIYIVAESFFEKKSTMILKLFMYLMIFVLLGFAIKYTLNIDSKNAVEGRNEFNVSVARIEEISRNSITLNEDTYKNSESEYGFTERYGLSLEGLNKGDIVEFETVY